MPKKIKNSNENKFRRFSICSAMHEYEEIARRAKAERRTVSNYMILSALGYLQPEPYNPPE